MTTSLLLLAPQVSGFPFSGPGAQLWFATGNAPASVFMPDGHTQRATPDQFM